jgi:hypothetical protein
VNCSLTRVVVYNEVNGSETAIAQRAAHWSCLHWWQENSTPKHTQRTHRRPLRRGTVGSVHDWPPQRRLVADVFRGQLHGHDERDQTVDAGVPLTGLDNWTLGHATATNLRTEKRRLPHQVVWRLLQAPVHNNRDFDLKTNQFVTQRGHKRDCDSPTPTTPSLEPHRRTSVPVGMRWYTIFLTLTF